jgi:hypothetical protein
VKYDEDNCDSAEDHGGEESDQDEEDYERLMKTRRCIEMKRTLPSKYASAAITELTRPIEVPPTVSGRSNRGGRR